ncbi:ABC transporter ATP-binding protein [Chitinophaga nivalis]|uniref:ATP-binding cassette domain-containing protein n=1 Tax=Chitinophaga nivalis TaxID=2991709 RepID=A0ABT3IWS2_9BACT|nr:ATP-binding cassette domain-containing protein [Chitinophaga nivalis]MCW3461878.1 ATP-binding cassette domain-containing protein [Chitinophaga nivalis]MCW3488431.1 ATP-binding cassette domain-containing protein [Chitinophaga nivalis]
MTISLEQTGKRFNYDWIFRRVTYTFHEGSRYAILGPNGSGKSTLLQVISGAIQHNEGTVLYHTPEKPIAPDAFFRHCAIAAPYLELIEELTLTETIQFHLQFKNFLPGITPEQAMQLVGLEKAAHKQIRNFSSGMKQRIKLALAIFSDVPVLLLDEPCTNLDAAGTALYQQLIRDYGGNRLIIVSSNDEQEYFMCTEHIRILDYK